MIQVVSEFPLETVGARDSGTTSRKFWGWRDLSSQTFIDIENIQKNEGIIKTFSDKAKGILHQETGVMRNSEGSSLG